MMMTHGFFSEGPLSRKNRRPIHGVGRCLHLFAQDRSHVLLKGKDSSILLCSGTISSAEAERFFCCSLWGSLVLHVLAMISMFHGISAAWEGDFACGDCFLVPSYIVGEGAGGAKRLMLSVTCVGRGIFNEMTPDNPLEPTSACSYMVDIYLFVTGVAALLALGHWKKRGFLNENDSFFTQKPSTTMKKSVGLRSVLLFSFRHPRAHTTRLQLRKIVDKKVRLRMDAM
ncbi:unnamed protein product [Ectocarpus sp. 8 AP-2014]